MIVVSDTSPITTLPAVEQTELLKQLFGEVVIPSAVETELLRTHPTLPAWLRVQSLQNFVKANLYARSVDRGEAEAIVLAEELHADHLLIDERKGRRLAQQQGLPVVGLLGVVLLAKRANLIPSARVLLEELDREAGIYLTDELKEAALKTVGE
jgi:Predicted nucleic acid-binding protein, contains PIN domain